MTTDAPSTALATIQPAFTDAERLALAGSPAHRVAGTGARARCRAGAGGRWFIRACRSIG